MGWLFGRRLPEGEMEAEAYSHLLQTAAEVVKTITLALAEEKITPEDAGEMQAIMLNIMEYLYGKYDEYSKVDQEVKNMIRTFYDPGLVEKGRQAMINKRPPFWDGLSGLCSPFISRVPF